MSMAEYTSSCECDSFYWPKMHFLKRKPKLMYPPRVLLLLWMTWRSIVGESLGQSCLAFLDTSWHAGFQSWTFFHHWLLLIIHWYIGPYSEQKVFHICGILIKKQQRKAYAMHLKSVACLKNASSLKKLLLQPRHWICWGPAETISCLRSCFRKALRSEKDLSQWLHLWGFSPVCTLSCFFRSAK